MGLSVRIAVKARPIKVGSPADVVHDSSIPSLYTMGKAIDMGGGGTVSVQLNWTDIVGTGGQAAVWVSNDGAKWRPKKDAVIPVVGATDSEILSINMLIVTEEFYKIVYTPGGVTSGTVECVFFGK